MCRGWEGLPLSSDPVCHTVPLSVDLPVNLGFADQLEAVFFGFEGLEDHIKLQSFQRQDCPKPIVRLDVHKLDNRAHQHQSDTGALWGASWDTHMVGVSMRV